jgi:hypothetical protein
VVGLGVQGEQPAWQLLLSVCKVICATLTTGHAVLCCVHWHTFAAAIGSRAGRSHSVLLDPDAVRHSLCLWVRADGVEGASQ